MIPDDSRNRTRTHRRRTAPQHIQKNICAQKIKYQIEIGFYKPNDWVVFGENYTGYYY